MLPMVATIVFVAFSLTTSMVSGIPVAQPSEDNEYRKYCSQELSEIISSTCRKGTLSLHDIYRK